MDDSKSLLNKTAAELTVKDQFVVTLAVPVILVGGLVVSGAALTVAERGVAKVRTFWHNRRHTDEG
jgi:hypothetical protein